MKELNHFSKKGKPEKNKDMKNKTIISNKRDSFKNKLKKLNEDIQHHLKILNINKINNTNEC